MLAMPAFEGQTSFVIVKSIHLTAYDAKTDIRIYTDFVDGYPDAKIKRF